MSENVKKLGKMGRALLEAFIEIRLGAGSNENLSDQEEEQIAVKKAIHNAANRLWVDWADKHLWDVFFTKPPKKKGLLIDFKHAAQTFYTSQTETDLGGVLTEILHEHDEFSSETAQKAVDEYIATLSEELLLVDKDFQKKALEQPDPRNDDVQPINVENLTIHSPLQEEQTKVVTSSKVTEEIVMMETRAKLIEKPNKKNLKPSEPIDEVIDLAQAGDGASQKNQAKFKKRRVKKSTKSQPESYDGNSVEDAKSGVLQPSQQKRKGRRVKEISQQSKRPSYGKYSKHTSADTLPAEDNTPLKHAEKRRRKAARVKLENKPIKDFPEPSLKTDESTIQTYEDANTQQTAQVIFEERSEKENQEPSLKSDSGIILKLEEEVTAEAACACLQKIPTKRVPRPADLPKASLFPGFRQRPFFEGRESEMKQLAAWLKGEYPGTTSQFVAITGIGGIGKTRLAHEFAHRYGRYFLGGVFWLNFSHPDMIPYEVAECSTLSYHTPLDIRIRQVLTDWKCDIPRLLIFDGCEDLLVLKKWLPTSGCSRVLVTSRQENLDLEQKFQLLPLTPLPRPASLALLRGHQRVPVANDPNLDTISGELEDNPLAIHLAGSFLRTFRKVVMPDQYLDALRQSLWLKVPSNRNDEFSLSKNELRMKLTIENGIDRLGQRDETNRHILGLLRQLACFVPGEFIPRELLVSSSTPGPGGIPASGEGLNQLVDMGLAEVNKAGDVLMHRLVARFIREILPDNGAQTSVEKTILSVVVAANQSKQVSRMQPFLTHLKQFTDLNLKKKDRQAAKFATELGYYLESIGDFAGARLYYGQAMEINRRVLGEESPDTTVSFNNLGKLLVKMGDYSGARPYFRQSLDIHRKVLGEEHPDTANSLNDLAELTANLGDYARAGRYYDQALKIRRKLLGENHLDTASSLNGLGLLMYKMGDYPNAHQYFEQALIIRRKVLGEEHPDTATSLNNEGKALEAMGYQQGARLYYEQALVIRMKVLGVLHPDTAASLTSMGILLQNTGDYPGARDYFEQALFIQKKVLGQYHPDTIASLNNLGNLAQAMGDQPGAKSYFEQALASNQEKLEEKSTEVPSRFNLLYLPLRTKIALAALLVLAVTVIGWQVFSNQNVSSSSLTEFVATPSEIGVAPNSWLFPNIPPKPTRTASLTPTATRTRIASPTRTKYLSPTPTKTAFIVILPTKTPTKTPTSFPTVPPPTPITPTNTFTLPTDTPTVVPSPTSANPTTVPTDTPGLPTPATPVLPTDTPITPFP